MNSDSTFLEFFGFMQGYIENEQSINSGLSCGYSSCSKIPQPTKQYDCYKKGRYGCPLNQCKGQIMNCTYTGSGTWDICEHVNI